MIALLRPSLRIRHEREISINTRVLLHFRLHTRRSDFVRHSVSSSSPSPSLSLSALGSAVCVPRVQTVASNQRESESKAVRGSSLSLSTSTDCGVCRHSPLPRLPMRPSATAEEARRRAGETEKSIYLYHCSPMITVIMYIIILAINLQHTITFGGGGRAAGKERRSCVLRESLL